MAKRLKRVWEYITITTQRNVFNSCRYVEGKEEEENVCVMLMTEREVKNWESAKRNVKKIEAKSKESKSKEEKTKIEITLMIFFRFLFQYFLGKRISTHLMPLQHPLFRVFHIFFHSDFPFFPLSMAFDDGLFSLLLSFICVPFFKYAE